MCRTPHTPRGGEPPWAVARPLRVVPVVALLVHSEFTKDPIGATAPLPVGDDTARASVSAANVHSLSERMYPNPWLFHLFVGSVATL